MDALARGKKKGSIGRIPSGLEASNETLGGSLTDHVHVPIREEDIDSPSGMVAKRLV